MRKWIWDRFVAWVVGAAKREYYHLPGYQNRWWLWKEGDRWSFNTNARVHQILRSDLERHFHDHPRPSISIILRGTYTEVFPRSQQQPAALDKYPEFQIRKVRKAGDIVFRRARTRHRLEITDGPCWSLFIMGRPTRSTEDERNRIADAFMYSGHAEQFEQVDIRRRGWGFYTERGWKYWRDYLNAWDVNTGETS